MSPSFGGFNFALYQSKLDKQNEMFPQDWTKSTVQNTLSMGEKRKEKEKKENIWRNQIFGLQRIKRTLLILKSYRVDFMVAVVVVTRSKIILLSFFLLKS